MNGPGNSSISSRRCGTAGKTSRCLIDKETGYFADPDKVHPIDHKGKHFKVRGPLNVSRPPQGHPLIVQAGSSEDGKNFATAQADAHFAIYSTREDGIKYRQDINERLARHRQAAGKLQDPARHPADRCRLRSRRPRQAGVSAEPASRPGRHRPVSSWSGIDLRPIRPMARCRRCPTRALSMAGAPRSTASSNGRSKISALREIARKLANSGSVPTVAGTPKQIADQLEDWFVAGAADGFNLMFPLLPEDWVNFAEQVVPELQRRGLVPTEYAPGTLRDRFGLARPANRFA